MKPYTDMNYYKLQEDLVKVIMTKTQIHNPVFFRIVVAYHLTKVASMMRCTINAPGIGNIPVNMYAINLSSSGSGKGFSTNIIEESVIHKFRKRFQYETFKELADLNIEKIAAERCSKQSAQTEEVIYDGLKSEFNSLGPLVFSFDSGTSPAVKQMRQKLLIANAGSINLEIDEIGSNLVSNTEVLNTFLELFDQGKVKQKLIKHTSENTRTQEIEGKTPTNMLLFGTPSKLFNGGKTEEEAMSMLETGYARRCFFGYSPVVKKPTDLTPEEMYDMLTDTSYETVLETIADRLHNLADQTVFGFELSVERDVMLALFEYKRECLIRAEEMPEFEEIQKAEMEHRYYKALKLAGTYAFIECNRGITMENLEAAIKLAEESGQSFIKMLDRPKVHERIARYLAEVKSDVTQTELMEALPYYRGSSSHRKDLMTMAIAWGYKNNIIIKTSYADSVELFKGEAMQETDLNRLRIAYSKDFVKDYVSEYAPWDKLHQLLTLDGYHYTAHHFLENYRSGDKCIPGFNLLILDVDHGTTIQTAQMLLKDYKALFATTKRHTPEHHRFRIILPISHTLKLRPEAHKKFMENIFEWLPFEVDTATKDCARKWETAENCHYVYQDGELFDVMPFIPDTKREADHKQLMLDHASLTNLERWFLLRASEGSRNSTLIKYAYILVDSGHPLDTIRSCIYAFNHKLTNPLPEDEINNTIMSTVVRAVTKRDEI